MSDNFVSIKGKKEQCTLGDAPGLKVVITGLGRSGTTFLAKCFLEAGSAMGSVTPALIGKGKCPRGGGLEHPMFVIINDRIMERISAGETEEKIAESLSDLMQYSWPIVVKDPRFLETIEVWGLAGVQPKQVFLCLRDTRATSQSMKKVWRWSDEVIKQKLITQRKFLEYCAKHGVSVTPVLFPRIALDQEYAQSLLEEYIKDPISVISRVWDEKLIRFETEDEFIESERRYKVPAEARKFEYRVECDKN